MEYLNTDISLLPPCPLQIQPTSAAQNISYSLHRNMNRYIGFFIRNIYSCFLLSSLPLGMRSPFLNSPPAFCHPASLKVCMGMLNAQSMQYSRTSTFFFFHTCIMCLCKLVFFFPCTIQLFIVWILEDLPQFLTVAIYLVNLFG